MIEQLTLFNRKPQGKSVARKFLQRAVVNHLPFNDASSVPSKYQRGAGQIRTAATHSGWSRIGKHLFHGHHRARPDVAHNGHEEVLHGHSMGKGWVFNSALSLPFLVDGGFQNNLVSYDTMLLCAANLRCKDIRVNDNIVTDLTLCPTPTSEPINNGLVDQREQLGNEGKIGSIQEVQLPEASITSLSAIMIDVDLKNFRPWAIPPEALQSPADFYLFVIKPMLDRSGVLAKAEVRNSGNGLHILLRFDTPLEFHTEEARDEWKHRIIILQRLLPSDPNCPSITALTRPVGSINGKNHARVVVLAPGTPVTAIEVEQLVEQVVAEPFKMVASILFGEDRISPCPNCQKPGSSMRVGNRHGRCYDCGKVELGALYDYFLDMPRSQEVE